MNKTKTSAYPIWFLISTTYYIYINHLTINRGLITSIDEVFQEEVRYIYYTSGRNKLFRKVDAHANKRLHENLGVKSFKMIVFCTLKLNLFTFLGLAAGSYKQWRNTLNLELIEWFPVLCGSAIFSQSWSI